MLPLIIQTEEELGHYLKQQVYTAKTIVTLQEMREVKHWIINNIGRSSKLWSITDYSGREFNWKAIAGAVKSKQMELARMPITIMVNFTHSEDLMLYLIRWPSDVLINS
jgi:hypothetical protein